MDCVVKYCSDVQSSAQCEAHAALFLPPRLQRFRYLCVCGVCDQGNVCGVCDEA